MFKLPVVLLLGAVVALSSALTPLESDSWALLVAGSNGWDNYRHQADICHSYHVMMNEGIPADHIIVMMYDDIAYNSLNPNKGVIINQPNGPNVYAGVKIDYKASEVTPKNFLNILSGNKTAMQNIGTGRVIESTSKQNVFVYFSDHGGAGLLAFPSEYLYADQLIKTMKAMYEKNQYKQLIFYVEACEAGSIFNAKLNEHHRIIAMTAAARDESSYGCYCQSSLGVCLGDLYSVTWMQRMDSEKKGTKVSIFEQYQKVRAKVDKSHVELYGDFSVGPDELTPNKDQPSSSNNISVPVPFGFGKQVDSRQIPLYTARLRVQLSKTVEEKQKLKKELQNMKNARNISKVIVARLIRLATGHNEKLHQKVMNERHTLHMHQFPCYRKLISAFEDNCFAAKNDYFLRHFYKFANLCVLDVNTSLLLEGMSHVCGSLKKHIQVEAVH